MEKVFLLKKWSECNLSCQYEMLLCNVGLKYDMRWIGWIALFVAFRNWKERINLTFTTSVLPNEILTYIKKNKNKTWFTSLCNCINGKILSKIHQNIVP